VFKNAFKILLLLIATHVNAQEMNGFVHSNYAGITGIQLNPTSIVNSKLYFDANLIGLHVNVDNNAIYLGKESYQFTRFFRNEPFPTHEVVLGDKTKQREFYDYYNKKLKSAYTQVKILGPGFMFSKNDRAFGVSTSLRNLAGAKNVPYEMAKFGAEGFDYYPLHKIRFDDKADVRAGAMSFAELALTYSQVIYKQNLTHITAGVTVKGLLGFGGAYWFIDNIDYMMPNGDTIVVYNANASAGISAPVEYSSNDVTFPDPLFYGSGVGFDIGFTYQRKMKGHSNKRYSACEQPFDDYYYSIGFSLIDLGFVKYKKNNLSIDMANSAGQWNDFTNLGIENIDVLFNDIDGVFSNTTVTNDAFKVFLPAAASIQFDYRIRENTYVNASVVYPIILGESAIVRPSQISVTPRIEMDKFEIAVPFTMYNFTHPRLGLSARLANVIIGTDKLGGFFGFNDFTGMDFYLMVKISLKKGFCLRGKGVFCGNHEYRQYQRDREKLDIR
jgi:hypothetical protein